MAKSKSRNRPNWLNTEQPTLDDAATGEAGNDGASPNETAQIPVAGAQQGAADTASTQENQSQQTTHPSSHRARGKGPLAPEKDEGPGSSAPGGSREGEAQQNTTNQAWSPGSGEQNFNMARDYLDSLGAGENDSPYKGLSDNGSAGWAASAGAALARIPGALGRWAAAHKLLAATVVLAVAFLLGYTLLSGGSDTAQPQPQDGATQEQEDPAATALAGSDPADAEDTGVTFSPLEQTDDGEAALATDDLSWEGEVTDGDEGQRITLQGPTAAEFERGFNLENSSISSGIYAVAQSDGPLLHVHTHTFVSDGEEITTGSIYAVTPGSEDDTLDYYGFYADERPDNADQVVRTYMQPSADSYPVSFNAPRDTPVPLLVGWRGPQGAPAEGEENPEGPTGAQPDAEEAGDG